MRVNKNIKFRTIGVKTIEEMDFNNPIVYSSDSLISSMSYAGDAEIITQSTTIDKDITDKLSKINGKFSLGLSGNELKNAHVYSKDAKYLDGICRICYLQQEGHELVVSEYHGNRGSKHSSLFKELSKQLSTSGFKDIKGKFRISRNDLDDFVAIINNVIEDKINGLLVLQVENNIDSITIKGKKYFYYKAYWIKEESYMKREDNKLQVDEVANSDIEDKIKEIANYALGCNEINSLETISEKIKTVDKLIENRIQALKELNLL
ncbi:hypothetical protein [Clostridium guangxiense]|uniref:hypothetical protein n=1 Tax=Clostridium guangxiense TaxID=1662055 RepID=UPI001E52745A|nr:hypothetical protein [Clostridium guangxiense]MCD2347205.1 hypothetical protein [Clostridium guangxiense]